MHISFDFDYTLADSSGGTLACASYAFDKLGINQPTSTRIIKTIGLSLEKTFEVLTGISANSVEARQFKAFFLDHADQVMLDHIHIYGGTRQTLECLKARDNYISIVSTKRRERIEEAITREKLDELVDDIIGGGCVANNKPHPEGLLLAMEKSSISATDTIYVGDSASDGECALRAGVSFIGLLSGQTDINELRKFKPIQILKSIESLRELNLG